MKFYEKSKKITFFLVKKVIFLASRIFSKPFYLFWATLILCVTIADASLQTYQNDLRNTGSSNGTGYFPLNTANFSVNDGMDFQPLVDDIDNDGYNEIIIFSNDFLKILDYELNLLDEKFAGTILGQPTIFSNKIIFNSRINDKNYFFAYQYSSSVIAQKFNITLSSDADFGGIKCLNLNGKDSCIFKDKLNYIHVVNIDSKTDSSYNTSVYNETRQTIPAIGDIDNDGNAEAVFWFNNDNSGGYGFLAFDLNERKIEWIADNIFTSIFGLPSTFALKGQPLLADLNNDNKLEIAASVFYDDNLPNFDPYNDWFTELFVYANNGTKLFSKCELNGVLNNGCNDGGSVVNKWEGTNPFVLDANSNGIDDICFIKDKKRSGIFKNMTINCYNYSGDLLLDSELSPSTDTIKTALIADMNNDGDKEIVTENRIYTKNGTSIFSHDLISNFAIPVDVDNNNRLDLIWTKNGMTKLFVDDSGAIKVSNVLIKPENPSVDDSLSCSWRVIGNNKVISANVTWYKNNGIYSNEIFACVNSTLCTTIDNIPSSALKENDVWKCSVTAFENNKKLESNAMHRSLPKSDTALVLSRNSEWTDFNKNRFAYGIASGNGYFSKSAISAIFYNSSGIDFQTMIADIDNNGENEIVLFANNSLILLNKSLNVIAQKQTGNLRGQFDIENMDDDSYLEVIAVVNNSNKDNFTVFEFNGSGIKIETSFDVSPQNGFQDIRCLDFDKDNATECIFRDYNGVAHSYQMNATNQNDDELNVNISDKDDNVFGSKANIAPSFVDFDRDNDLEALFWFNDDFAVIDSNKNIILNVDVGTLNAFISSDPTLLGLKFVNLDKAGDYEIAVAYRHDYQKVFSFKTDINLSLFNSQGNAIFSKIIDFYNVNPCSNYNAHCLGFGSDLFVYDYNKDGFDDIGIYVEGSSSSLFGAFIKFFDRNGIEIASSKAEFGEGNSIPQAVTLADMDSDNELELILRRRIYALDGAVLYNFSDSASKAPIAVDVDKNKGLDLLWFDSNKLNLLLDNNSYKADLSIEEKDISFQPLNRTSVLVTAIVHNNGNLNLGNVKIELSNTETLESVKGAISIKRRGSSNFTVILNLKQHDKVMAQVNYDSSIGEDNDKNNFAEKMFEGLPYVYVSADLFEPSNIVSEFKDYIKNKLTSGYYTANEGSADITVYIGKNNPINKINNIKTLNDFEFGYDYGNIVYYDKTGTNPYSALVAGFKDSDGKIKIMIVGNEIEGTIAATKEFIKNHALFLNTADINSVFVDDENAQAVKVFDYLHNEVNKEHYDQQSNEFKDIVKNALNENIFSEINYNVTTANNVILRLRNLKPDVSNDYLLFLNSSLDVFMPVVMSGGIWADISSWQELGGELSSDGRDVWLIEVTGGSNIECDECINYNYTDLVDDFWPALIGAVQKQTGKGKIQYVAHSNGCRTALDSLSNWSSTGKTNVGKIIYNSNEIMIDMLPNPVDTFVGVACPGNFSELSYFAKQVKTSGSIAIERLQNKNKLHPKFGDVAHELESVLGEIAGVSRLFDNPKISLNLFKQYYDWIKSDDDKQPGSKLNFKYFTLIYGTDGFLFSKTDDQIVAVNDELAIYNKINSSNKKFISVAHKHTGMTEGKSIKSHVKKSLDRI